MLVVIAGGAYFFSKQTTLTSQDETANWKTYTETNGDFSFQYPPNLTVNSTSENSKNIELIVQDEEMNSIGFQPYRYDQETAAKDKSELRTGMYGESVGNSLSEARKVVKIGSSYGKTLTQIGQIVDVCGSEYSRRVIFYTNTRRVIISLILPKDVLYSSFPEYFIQDKASCGDTKIFKNGEQVKLYQALVNKQLSGKVQDWFDNFDKIVKSIQIKS